jgi:DNA uptake protein ComE-like DNA-binding protein
MRMSITLRGTLLICTATIVLGVSGCGFIESDNKTEEQKREEAQRTRDEVAKATERAKPALQKAGQELKEAAKTAAEQAHAAAQGVKEGWERGRADKLDLNSAKESEILALPGINRREARKIVAGRPYDSPHDVVDKGILSEDEYRAIRSQVTAK